MLEIPFDVKKEWGKARAPVAAEINGHTFRSTVAVYGGRYLLGLNRHVRESAGVRAGDRVVVDLELDTAERVVEPPPELRAAFAHDPELRAFFDSLSFTHRNEYATLDRGGEEGGDAQRPRRQGAGNAPRRRQDAGLGSAPMLPLSPDRRRVEDEARLRRTPHRRRWDRSRRAVRAARSAVRPCRSRPEKRPGRSCGRRAARATRRCSRAARRASL
jgi:hypothetical protein